MSENPFNLEDPRDRVLCAWLLGELDSTSPAVCELREREPGIDQEFHRLRRVESTVRAAAIARAAREAADGGLDVPDLSTSVEGEDAALAGFRATMGLGARSDADPVPGPSAKGPRPVASSGSDTEAMPSRPAAFGSKQLLVWIAAAAAVLLVVQLGWIPGGDRKDPRDRSLLNAGGPIDPGTRVLPGNELQWTLAIPNDGSFRLEFRIESEDAWDLDLRVEGLRESTWRWDGVEPSFEAGATYRWRVTALDGFGRVKDSLHGGPFSPDS